MANCKQCNNQFNPSDVARVYGIESSVLLGGFCSAACYTKNATTIMKDFSKATPRPWQQNFLKSFIETSDKTKNICEMSVNENDANFSYDEYKQNGELIVTAVNNFEKMKELIIRSQKEIIHLKQTYRDSGHAVKYLHDVQQLLESIK